MTLLENLPHTATAKRRTRTADAMGGTKDSFDTTLFTDKSCWRQPATDSEVERWMQQSQAVTHKIYFVEDPGIDEQYIIEIGDDTMEVVSVGHPDRSAGLGVLWRVMVRLV